MEPFGGQYLSSGPSRITLCIMTLLYLLLCAQAAESAAPDPAVKEKLHKVADDSADGPKEVREQVRVEDTETEVVGFRLHGRRLWERLNILDMDALVTGDKERYLPLLRLLKVLKIKSVEKGNEIFFKPDGRSEVIVSPSRKEVQVRGLISSIDVIEAFSEITGKRDIYLSEDIISQIFSMDLRWDRREYAFIGKTNQHLPLWERPEGRSLFSVKTTEVPEYLPEEKPPALPPDFSLDFLEHTTRFRVTAKKDSSSNEIAGETFRQTAWGSLFGGKYELQLEEPRITYSGSGTEASEDAPVMVKWADWTYRFSSSEVVLGDSVFGLNSLTFPLVRMTGIRFNGLTGISGDAAKYHGSLYGLKEYFIEPRVFDGTAETGSEVTLMINDRTIEVQEVYADNISPPGSGVYSFENIRLPAGSLNDIRIIIRDPNGVETEIRETILESPRLLPEGRAGYLGGIGTSRDKETWKANGIFAGARMLYGLHERLTLGGTFALQDNLYQRYSTSPLDSRPAFPQSGTHLGGQFAWLLMDSVLVSGDMSLSDTEDITERNLAYLLRSDIYLKRDMSIHPALFGYGPDFFNGQNPDLHDRRGYYVNFRGTLHPDWTVSANMAQVSDNILDDRDDTLVVDFHNMEITSNSIPRTRFTLGVDTVSNGANEGRALYSMDVVVRPFQDMKIKGEASFGDSLLNNDHSELMSGIRVPGIDLHTSPSHTLMLTENINREHSVGIADMEYQNIRRTYVYHSYISGKTKPLRIRTEVGHNTYKDSFFWKNRLEYELDRDGRKRIGLHTRADDEEWTAMLLFDLNDLFSFNRGSMKKVKGRSVTPETGGVHGRVFLDFNANAVMDPGEPGVEDVKVKLQNIYSSTTDEDGYYVIGGLPREDTARVFIDMNTVLAIYSPTHATQIAHIRGGSLTEVNLGIMPVIAVTGTITLEDPDKGEISARGVKVYLKDAKSGLMVSTSYTGSGGSYYFGNVRPGKYVLEVDPETLPERYVMTEPARSVEVMPAKEPVDIEIPRLQAVKEP